MAYQHGYNPQYGSAPPAQGYGQQYPGGYMPPQQQLPPGCPPGVDPTIFYWFQAVDNDRSGRITAAELRSALLNNNNRQFNQETCRLMIGMFDKDRDGKIDVYEFAALWNYIQQWQKCFDSFDRDRSGNIDANELNQALITFGYRLSPKFSHDMVRIFSKRSANTMEFDNFIQLCVMMRMLTDKFRAKDQNQNGVIQLRYEEFLEMVLDNTLNVF